MGLNEIQKKERSEYLEKNLTITECSQRIPYVFISYASDNWETVFKSAVVPLQKQYGLRVYADKAFDKVNDKWIVPMLRNIRGSDMVLAFVSQSYIESYACFLELLTAVNNRKKIVFVSLGDHLRLGDTTDLPVIGRGVKNEILNQGANISTNTNNTSNDIMRAMKSAFTSLATLLEQDALAKYDISDAFINFFRDASVNRKTITDLKAVKQTIQSVSREVFDKSLIQQPIPAPQTEPTPEPAPNPAPVQQPKPAPQTRPSLKPIPQPALDFSSGNPQGGKKTKKPLNVKLVSGITAAAIVLFIAMLSGGKNVTDQPYTLTSEAAASFEIYSGLYTGEWDKKNKWPSGTGTFTSDGNEWTYEGEWADGIMEGQGTATYSNGDVYKGEFKDDYPNGQGTYTSAKGDVYEGEFKDGYRNGQGTMTYSNGDIYKGEWQDDYRNGQGTYTWTDGDAYEGEWKNDYRNGQGVYTDANGNQEEQTWSNGARVLEMGNGTYIGAVKDGKPNGVGTMNYTNGNVYVGEWVDGVMEGQGTKTWASGDVYEGEWKGGVIEGHGTMTWANGTIYEGEWKDNKADGQGVYTDANGNQEEQTWSNGEMVQPSL